MRGVYCGCESEVLEVDEGPMGGEGFERGFEGGERGGEREGEGKGFRFLDWFLGLLSVEVGVQGGRARESVIPDPRHTNNNRIQLPEYRPLRKKERPKAKDLSVRAQDEGGVDRG